MAQKKELTLGETADAVPLKPFGLNWSITDAQRRALSTDVAADTAVLSTAVAADTAQSVTDVASDTALLSTDVASDTASDTALVSTDLALRRNHVFQFVFSPDTDQRSDGRGKLLVSVFRA